MEGTGRESRLVNTIIYKYNIKYKQYISNVYSYSHQVAWDTYPQEAQVVLYVSMPLISYLLSLLIFFFLNLFSAKGQG